MIRGKERLEGNKSLIFMQENPYLTENCIKPFLEFTKELICYFRLSFCRCVTSLGPINRLALSIVPRVGDRGTCVCIINFTFQLIS